MQVEAKTILALGTVAIAGFVVWRVSKAAGAAASAAATAVGQGAIAVGTAVNPLNNDNVFATGVNKVVQAVTGDTSATLGTKLFDWWNPNEMDWLNAPVTTLKSGGGGDYQGNGATGSW